MDILTEQLDLHVPYNDTEHKVAANFRQSDGGTLIVALHGLGCAKESFDGAFSQLHNSILAIDYLGHGDSDKPEEGFDYTIADHASIVIGAIQKVTEQGGIKENQPLALLGHSMGGAVGIHVAEKLGSKVTHFINIEGNLVAEDAFASGEMVDQKFTDFKETGHQAFVDTLKTEPSTEAWGEWSSNTSPVGLYKSAQGLVASSRSDRLLERFVDLGSTVKTAYIYGDQSSDLPGLSDYIPLREKGTIRSIEGAGHFAMLDKPTELYRVVARLIHKYPEH